MSILSIGKIPKRSPYRFWTLLEKTKDSNTGRKSVRQAWDKAMQKKWREIVPSEVKAIPIWCFVLADSGQTSYYCVVYLKGQCHKNFERFGGCARGSLLASQRKATHVYSMWDLKVCCLILSIQYFDFLSDIKRVQYPVRMVWGGKETGGMCRGCRRI